MDWIEGVELEATLQMRRVKNPLPSYFVNPRVVLFFVSFVHLVSSAQRSLVHSSLHSQLAPTSLQVVTVTVGLRARDGEHPTRRNDFSREIMEVAKMMEGIENWMRR